MKKEELLKKINELPDGIEICIFDYLMNIEGESDGDDKYFEGIYRFFEIELMDKDDLANKKNPWACISFVNPDYQEDGKVKLLEEEIKEYEENEL